MTCLHPIVNAEAGRASFITGDVFDVLATIPDGSIDLILTSPPFLALRSYLPADHPDKHREIGSEPDPASFLATLLALTAEWRRVLAPHGSICVELGDTYSGSGGGGGDYLEGGMREGQQQFAGSAASMRESNAQHWRNKAANKSAWPLPKSLCGIPHLFHLSLAYGRNLLTGEPCEPWRVRNVVAWCRPNPPVGALGDKFRPATSYMTIACPSGSRYFDLDAVRTPHVTVDAITRPRANYKRSDSDSGESTNSGGNPAGAPPLDWWEIPTTPYSGAHYAAFPPALLERPIKSMAPSKVCTVCGEPSRRIVDADVETKAANAAKRVGPVDGRSGEFGDGHKFPHFDTPTYITTGWTDCGHDAWRPGVVLDPFGGSGTTLSVATGYGHHAIGIDLDPRNVDLARDRVGPMFLDEFTLDEWKNR